MSLVSGDWDRKINVVARRCHDREYFENDSHLFRPSEKSYNSKNKIPKNIIWKQETNETNHRLQGCKSQVIRKFSKEGEVMSKNALFVWDREQAHSLVESTEPHLTRFIFTFSLNWNWSEGALSMRRVSAFIMN